MRRIIQVTPAAIAPTAPVISLAVRIINGSNVVCKRVAGEPASANIAKVVNAGYRAILPPCRAIRLIAVTFITYDPFINPVVTVRRTGNAHLRPLARTGAPTGTTT